MINIIEKSREFNDVETYLMTIAPSITSIKDVEEGTKIEVDGYLMFDDVKENGDTSEIMSIITTDKKVYSTKSATFKRSLKDIATIKNINGKPFTIVKINGETKGGRPFVNCILDIESLLN